MATTNGTLLLGKNYIQTGLGTLTFTVPATVSSLLTPVVNIPFAVSCQLSIPAAAPTGAGSGSGSDQGLGALGGTQGIGQGTGLGNGGTGLGFGGTPATTYIKSGSGHGAGAGGGVLGEFSLGGGGTGDGATGQGFGASASGYNQPSVSVNTSSSGATITSGLSVVINLNGSPVYTAPVLGVAQRALQFTTPGILCNSTDTITVVFSSSTASDETLIALQANVNVTQGQF
jgi:hypothetical protein